MHLFLFDPFDNSLLANKEKKKPHPPNLTHPFFPALSPLSLNAGPFLLFLLPLELFCLSVSGKSSKERRSKKKK